jgi:hypothetical protein
MNIQPIRGGRGPVPVPVPVPVPGRGRGSGNVVGIVLLISLIVLIIFLLSTGPTEESILKNSTNKLNNAANAVGLDPEELQTEINNELKEDAKRCMVNPRKDGKCGPNYTLEEGCCYPDTEAGKSKLAAGIATTKYWATTLSLNIVASTILGKMAFRAAGVTWGGMAAGSAAAASYRASLRAAQVGKSVATGARAGVVAARTSAAVGAKYAVAAAGGPIGLAIIVAMAIFDAVTIAMDILDIDGYDSFTSQTLLTKIKNVADYEQAKALEQLDLEFPMLFPIAFYYKAEFEASLEYAQALLYEKHLTTVLDEEIKKSPSFGDELNTYYDKILAGGDDEMPESLIVLFSSIPDRFHIDRDRFIFKKMQELMGSNKYKIQLYGRLSTAERIGISLSQRGAQEHNEAHKSVWYKKHDLFKPGPPSPDEEEPEPPVCLYTDTYYVYESGPSDNPKMVARKLPVKTVLVGYYGNIVSFCEKIRQVKKTSRPIDPYALGVRFDFETGICNFTREFCSRYGMEFRNNNCVLRPGQKYAEMIFGTTTTRAIIRAFTTPPSYAKSSKLPKKGSCPSGMRDDGMNCWLDAIGRGVGYPLQCREGDQRVEALCYPRCRQGYTSMPFGFCEETCPLYKDRNGRTKQSTNDGLFCTQWIHSYIPGNKTWNPFKGGFWERASCRDGFRDRGTTCNEECADGFSFKSGSLGTAFCNRRRGRYARTPYVADSCRYSDRPEKHDGLCYKKCNDKGPDGKYKYTGVGPLCHPVGGARIGKGLNDRWECDEGWRNILGICYKNCKPGEDDDGLLCNPN